MNDFGMLLAVRLLLSSTLIVAMVPQQWFGASKRALAASQGGPAWAMMSKVKKLPQYDAEKMPQGVIDLSGAENGLMEDWMCDFARSHDGYVAPENSLSYGAISGSNELLVAMASFFNRFFVPHAPIQPSNILVANGVTSLIDLVAWSICDAGDGVVYPTPNFYMLDIDLTIRSRVETVPVSCSKIADPFKASGADALVACLEEGIDAATRRGINCRVLFICNPANPQGRCYSKRTLVALKELCSRRRMHLVSDEIYAMSQFQPDTTHAAALDGFSSVLSLSQGDSKATEPSNVHCLYGLSKDFGMGGLRMSFLVTQNEQVLDAMKRVTWFTWVSNFSDAFVKNFMSQPDKVQEYMETYHSRLTQAYHTISSTLTEKQIPFQEANCGLFVSVNLSGWLDYFAGTDRSMRGPSREIQLCEYLVDHGVFLNPGEFAGDDRPGRFRLVFTGGDIDTVVLAIQRLRKALCFLEGSVKYDHVALSSCNNVLSATPSLSDEKRADRDWVERQRNVRRRGDFVRSKLHLLLGCFR